jgi:hypothetical protein
MSNGKGDARRPTQVSQEIVEENYYRTFPHHRPKNVIENPEKPPENPGFIPDFEVKTPS